MAFRAEQVAVGTTAVKLDALADTDPYEGRSLAVLSCTVDIFLGATNAVTSSTGAKLAAGQGLALDLHSGDAVWAVAAATGVAHVAETGV